MDREKEIEEFVKIELNEQRKCYESSCDGCDCAKYGLFNCRYARMAKAAVRKADEVRKETAKEIFKEVVKLLDEAVPKTKEFTTLLWLAAQIKTKYGIEVDE